MANNQRQFGRFAIPSLPLRRNGREQAALPNVFHRKGLMTGNLGGDRRVPGKVKHDVTLTKPILSRLTGADQELLMCGNSLMRVHFREPSLE